MQLYSDNTTPFRSEADRFNLAPAKKSRKTRTLKKARTTQRLLTLILKLPPGNRTFFPDTPKTTTNA